MGNPLFSTYSQGENRVTASILAVLERISFAVVERILQALFQEPETPLLTFTNQAPGPNSTPDARIRASFAYWIETKIEKKAVSESQIRAHLRALDGDHEAARQRLLVLTPDDQMPLMIKHIDDPRVAWASFDDLVHAIQDLADPQSDWFLSDRPLVTEQERSLLRELVGFLTVEGLVATNRKRVAIVAARLALREYLTHTAYMCQPGRIFQTISHLGFYTDKVIYHCVPEIEATVDNVILSRQGIDAALDLEDDARARLIQLVETLEREQSDRLGEEQKVMFLSAPTDQKTVVLRHDIVNDLTSDTGRSIAFTQGQRYVWLDQLLTNPKTTSEVLATRV